MARVSSRRATTGALSGIWRNASDASPSASAAAFGVARWSRCLPKRSRRCGANGQTFITRRRSNWCVRRGDVSRGLAGPHHGAEPPPGQEHQRCRLGGVLHRPCLQTILVHKAACAGREVIAVHPAFTTQACSGCGGMVSTGLSVRWHRCPDCGTSLHRDHNAARNIHWRGQRLRGLAGAPAGMNREPAGL